jgi:hypothetical protein
MQWQEALTVKAEITEVYPDAVVKIQMGKTGASYTVEAQEGPGTQLCTFHSLAQFEVWRDSGEDN